MTWITLSLKADILSYNTTAVHGGVQEWPIWLVSKTMRPQGHVGSNPTPSAIPKLVIVLYNLAMLSVFSRIPILLLVLVSAICVVLGDYFGKQWLITLKPLFYILSLITYLGSAYFYLPVLLREGLVVTSVIWSTLSIVGFLLVGIVIFHEVLSTMQIVGVLFGVIALIILSLAN